MAQILSSRHTYLPNSAWRDQDIYMKSLAYPLLSLHLKHIISSETTQGNAFLHITPLFRRWGASPVEPSPRLL